MGTVRASAMKHYLGELERGPIPGTLGVLAQIDPEVRRRIEAAARTDWLPIEVNFDATELLTRDLGIEQGEAFFRHLYAGFLEGPVLRPLLQGIRALGARSPLAYLKHAPRSYSAVFRDVGRVSLSDKSDNHAELHFQDMPAVCFAPTMPWIRYTAAIYALSFDLTQCPGRQRIEQDPDNRLARVIYEW